METMVQDGPEHFTVLVCLPCRYRGVDSLRPADVLLAHGTEVCSSKTTTPPSTLLHRHHLQNSWSLASLKRLTSGGYGVRSLRFSFPWGSGAVDGWGWFGAGGGGSCIVLLDEVDEPVGGGVMRVHLTVILELGSFSRASPLIPLASSSFRASAGVLPLIRASVWARKLAIRI
ncbi:hypothetical protein JZ751_018259 [Albula glossodonta]|uniref:Uncharacterized protein n=1 Tax=Albula glossodonta TaxID=121402 RepID=A0A8T2NWI1_9TELE|nr:hypothetical protein JZ751_018259 [Albula glossodonta]